MTTQKRKVGRPTNYKPEYCEALIEHMKKGYSFESFGATMGISRDNVYEWAKKHPEFSEAKKLALDQSLLYWERQGKKGLWSHARGKQFNATVWIFNMKNRHNWRDNKEPPPSDDAPSNAPQIVVNLPDNGRQVQEPIQDKLK